MTAARTGVVRRLANGLLITLLVLGAVVVVGASALLRTDAVRADQVLTGSMEPGIPVGAVVLGTPLDPGRVEVGDVIMFRPPAPFTTPGDRPVVHRVTSVETIDGVRAVGTRGDANASDDPWLLDAHATTFFEVRASSPVLGAVARYGARLSWPVLLGVPVALIAMAALRSIWRPARRGAHRAELPASV